MGLQTVACYLCRSPRSTFWAEEAGYTAVRCDGCGTIYVNPRPAEDDIDEAARTGMHATERGEVTFIGRFRPLHVRRLRRVVRRLLPEVASGAPVRWLDVGAGHGELLAALTDLLPPGSTILGVEPNEHKRAGAAERGLAMVASLDDVPDQPFDVVSSMNVYSHLPDPPSFYRQLRSLLVPDGALLIETGNAAELADRDEYPDALLLPDHLTFTGEPQLRRLLADIDMEVVDRLDLRFDTPAHLAVRVSRLARRRETRLFVPYRSAFRDMFVLARPVATAATGPSAHRDVPATSPVHLALAVVRGIWGHPSNAGRRGRQLLQAVRFQLRGRLLRRPTVVPVGRRSTLVAHLHDHGAALVAYANPHDRDELLLWERLLRPGDVFVDVGANVGSYAIWALERGAEVIAFEPDDQTRRRLLANVERNGFRIDARPQVVADVAGRVDFTDDLGPMNHLVRVPDGRFESVTLDEALRDQERVRGVKVDVEGFERLVLEGASALLREQRVDVFQLEWNDLSLARLREGREPVARLLTESGYRLLRADGEPAGPEPGPDVFAVSARAHDEVRAVAAELRDEAGRAS